MPRHELNGTWKSFDRQGLAQGREVVQVYPATEMECEHVRIGGTLHRRDELKYVQDEAEDRLEGPGGWYLTRKPKGRENSTE
jgi:hypothetical protein